MDEANTKLLAELAVKLTESAVRNTAGMVADKITKIKAKRDEKQTIRELEGIVNDLLDDKNELIRIAKTFEQELVSQRISDDDIVYITTTLVPLAEKFVEKTGDEKERTKNQENLDMVKAVLSKETIMVMQLIGFNFKQAIGEPLTSLIRRLIESKMPINDAELKRLNVINSNLSIEIAKDEAATNRLMKLLGRS